MATCDRVVRVVAGGRVLCGAEMVRSAPDRVEKCVAFHPIVKHDDGAASLHWTSVLGTYMDPVRIKCQVWMAEIGPCKAVIEAYRTNGSHVSVLDMVNAINKHHYEDHNNG